MLLELIEERGGHAFVDVRAQVGSLAARDTSPVSIL
jgi:hypothetical protein